MKRLMLLSLVLVGCGASKGAYQEPTRPAYADKPKTAAETFALAMKEQGSLEDRMRDVVETHPTYGPAWYNLGVALGENKDYEEAEQAYRRALLVDEKLSKARINLAALLFERGERDAAVKLLEAVVRNDATAADAHLALSRILLESGDPKGARRLAENALGRDPRNIEAYCVLAEAARRRKDGQRLRLTVSRGLKIEPKASCLLYSLAEQLLAEGRDGEALAQFKALVAAEPDAYPEAHFRIGMLAFENRDLKTAIRHFERSTQLSPGSAGLYVNLGVAKKTSGDFEGAAAAYKKAFDASGKTPNREAMRNMGLLYLRYLNRYQEAAELLERYLALPGVSLKDPAKGWLEEAQQRIKLEEELSRRKETPASDTSHTDAPQERP